jgi:hypothetical protein
LKRLQATAAELEQAGTDGGRRREGLDQELKQVEGRLAGAERALADAKQAQAARPHSYAVVPYEGRNQTRRRPIYLECVKKTVVLQPEGITLVLTDFIGPQGPGNPLAAAVRAARQHLMKQGDFDPKREGEPYPLLLVRPSGIIAHDAARGAMKAWGSDFGYEMIGEDWQLQFPKPNPQLAEEVRQAVELARTRQRELIAAAPNRYRKSAVAMRPSGEMNDEDESDDDDASGFFPGQPVGRVGSPYGTGPGGLPGRRAGGGGPVAGPGTGGGGSPGQGGLPYGSLAGGGMPGQGSGASGQGSPGTAAGGLPYGSLGPGGGSGPAGVQGTGSGTGGGPVGAAAGGTPGQQGVMAGGTPAPQGGMPGGTSTQEGPALGGTPAPQGPGPVSSEGFVAGRPAEAQPAPRPDPDRLASRQPGTPPRPGEWHPPEEYAPPKRDDKKDDDDKRKRDREARARAKNHDRGFDNIYVVGSVAVSRVIRAECYPDRLVFLSEGRTAVVPLMSSTAETIDQINDVLWEHIDSWGIAGKGMYWRPVLQVSVAPGAELRYADLSILLEKRGLVVQKK